jgi:hypothetical protein
VRWNKQIKLNKKEDSANRGKARQGKARQGKARQGKARQGKARQGKARNVIYQWAESNDGRISNRSRNGRKSNNESCEYLSLQLSFVPPAGTETHMYGQMLVYVNSKSNKRLNSFSADNIMSTSMQLKYRK